MRAIPVPVPLGLVERTAAGLKARFDTWPAGYVDFCVRWCRGGIPERVLLLVKRLEKEKPWTRCSHGTDLSVGLGFCRPCHGLSPEP